MKYQLATPPNWIGKPQERTYYVHLMGGGEVDLRMDSMEIGDLAQALQRNHPLIGRVNWNGGPDSDVLIPAHKVLFVSSEVQ